MSEVAPIGRHMAKSDSFYIRAFVEQPAADYAQAEIDLGSFVNLGVKSSTLLRIHNLAVQIANKDAPEKGPIDDTAVMNIGWNLTTQSHSSLVHAFDKSVVASGRYEIAADRTGSAKYYFAQDTRDVMPQEWKNGYLVGVDSLFLSTDSDQTSDNGAYYVTIVMECTLENATQASATALALSQQ
jgi:hypothetical protein